MAAPTAPRKNFITRDHRYVYLGGSFIALLGLGMFYSAPSPYSFIPAQSVFGTALAAICWFFLGVSAMALLVKWAYWNNYSSTIMKRPLIVRVSRYLSYLDAAACALLVLDRFILKLAYIINAAIHADSNPTDTLSMMAYMRTTSARSSPSAFVHGAPRASSARRSRSCWRFSWSFSAFRSQTSVTTTL